MLPVDIYSKRLSRSNSPVADVFVYDHVPDRLAIQIMHFFTYALGGSENQTYVSILQRIRTLLLSEYGATYLSHTHLPWHVDIVQFISYPENVEQWIDAIELFVQLSKSNQSIELFLHRQDPARYHRNIIEETINVRFKEHSFGYRVDGSQVFRIESEHLHNEVVVPVLILIGDPCYQTVDEEYRAAWDKYKNGDYSGALTDANRAYESTLKIICSKRSWPYNQKDTVAPLVSTVKDNGLFPPFLSTALPSISQLMTSSIGTIRNNLGGHGAGVTPQNIEAQIVTFQLHMTAATIKFLIECEKSLPISP